MTPSTKPKLTVVWCKKINSILSHFFLDALLYAVYPSDVVEKQKAASVTIHVRPFFFGKIHPKKGAFFRVPQRSDRAPSTRY